jgi:hypothetical protein
MVDTRFPPRDGNDVGLGSLLAGHWLREVDFSAQAGQQEGRKDHPLAKSEAKIQLVHGAQQQSKHVLNVCAFSVSAYLPTSTRYVTAELHCKDFPGIDNLTAGIVAPESFWRRASLRNAAEPMKQFWQSSLQSLAADAMVLVEQAPMTNPLEIEGWVHRHLNIKLQQCAEMLLGETSKEIKLHLASAQP